MTNSEKDKDNDAHEEGEVLKKKEDHKKFILMNLEDLQGQISHIMDFASTATKKDFYTMEGYIRELDNVHHEVSQLKEALFEFNATAEEQQTLNKSKELRGLMEDMAIIRGKYFKLKADIDEEKSQVQQPGNSVSSIQSVISTPNKNIKLDKIKIKIFDGDLKNWLGFYESFKELVHNDLTLKDIEKFHHLLSHLEGEPLKIAQRYSITSSNYSLVIKALEDRYNSKRLLLSHLVGEVVNYKQDRFDLKTFLQQFQGTQSQLEKLNLNNIFEDFYFQICYSFLPNFWKSKVDDHFSSDEIPKLTDFFDYILSQTKSSENRNYARNASTRDGRSDNAELKPRSNRSFLSQDTATNRNSQNNNNNNKCVSCSEKGHFLYQCQKFLGMNVDERFLLVKSNNVCFNCLRVRERNHTPCSFQKKCRLCGKPHNTLLHKEKSNVESHENNGQDAAANGGNGFRTCHVRQTKNVIPNVLSAIGASNVIFGTIQAYGQITNTNKVMGLTCLFDPCSDTSMITHGQATELGLVIQYVTSNIKGVNGAQTSSLGVTNIRLYRNKSSKGYYLDVELRVVDEITSPLPAHDLSFHNYCKLSQFPLADKLFYKRKEIHILLGGDVFDEIITNPRNNKTFVPGPPSLLYSKFGYIVIGKINQLKSKGPNQTFLTFASQVTENSIDELYDSCSNDTMEDALAEEFYQKTTFRDPNGTYVVSLPFKSCQRPENNAEQAMQRFRSLERKMFKDSVLTVQHHLNFTDYFDLGHMETAKKEGKYYIPYHYVVRPEATTTKYRAVFDASSHNPQNLSLNDCLMRGPNLYNNLSDILMRFQIGGKYTLTADLSKFYRRIKVNEDDTQYQHCFYKGKDDSAVKDIKINCVVFGIKPSPFLAIRTLHQLVTDEGNGYPLATRAILESFYMDNCALSKPTINEVQNTASELEALCGKGNLPIHKFASNSRQVLSQIPTEKQEPISQLTANDFGVKVLGLKYDTVKDEFLFVMESHYSKVVTKRSVLANSLSLFDPQGFLQPMIFWAKIFLNKLWKANLAWDAPIVGELLQEWNNFSFKFRLLNQIRIPRYIPVDVSISINLLGTCDASLKGIAANIYLQCILEHDKVVTQLLKAKSKVEQKKSLTIPKLELSAAALLSQMVHDTIKALNISFNASFLFSDSKVALAWIKSTSTVLPIYVRNRVKTIKEFTQESQWVHISGVDNPSDLATRGLDTEQFLQQKDKWFYGPPLFQKKITLEGFEEVDADVEIARVFHMHLSRHDEHFLHQCFYKVKNYGKLTRIFGYVFRFIQTLKLKLPKAAAVLPVTQVPPLTVEELDHAVYLLARISQRLHFSEELECLDNRTKLKSVNRHFCTLNPQLNQQGLLVVGGRLGNSDLPEDAKHPIILSNKSKLAEMVGAHYHKKYFHAGPNLTLALTRGRFWIINGKNLIKRLIAKCNRCLRFFGKPQQQIMSDLPKARVTPSRPFAYSGCDVGGPIMIKTSKLRKAPQQKAYFVIFVCFATKACHIETITELTTECFLAYFERFTSRRGLVKRLHSDCGSNFVGAKRQIQEVILFFKENHDTIFSSLAARGVEWHLNPPYSPHMGGIWERQVRSIKDHLYKQLNPVLLTYEEFNTVLCYVEAILNSRPLQPLDENIESIDCLTPAHFLIGDSLFAVPREQLDLNRTLKTRWLMTQQKCQALWHRWSAEYLCTLQQRFKWQNEQTDIKPGQVVYISDFNTAPLNYPLGRILSVNTSTDGKVRSATVRTAAGVYVRPIVRLIPLNTNDEL